MGGFGTAVIIISCVAVVVAIVSFWGSGKIYRGLGRSGPFSMEEEIPQVRDRIGAIMEERRARAAQENR